MENSILNFIPCDELINDLSDIFKIINKLEDYYVKQIKIIKSNNIYPNEYLKLPYGIWFRGLSISDYDLKPSIFRNDVGDKWVFDESNIFQQFSLQNPEILYSYKSNFEILTLMQHYGFPTRLLDWSESILIAIFFAVNKNFSKDAKLCVLDALKFNYTSSFFENNFNLFKPENPEIVIRSLLAECIQKKDFETKLTLSNIDKYGIDIPRNVLNHLDNFSAPIAVYPFRSNPRMIVQKGVFTLHGGKKSVNYNDLIIVPKSIDDENKNIDDKFLAKIIIPSAAKEKILHQLNILGINESCLFPEFENQANYLKKIWRINL